MIYMWPISKVGLGSSFARPLPAAEVVGVGENPITLFLSKTSLARPSANLPWSPFFMTLKQELETHGLGECDACWTRRYSILVPHDFPTKSQERLLFCAQRAYNNPIGMNIYFGRAHHISEVPNEVSRTLTLWGFFHWQTKWVCQGHGMGVR